MKKVRVIGMVILACILLTALTIPALTQEVDIESLIELYISDPVAGTAQLIELVKTNPEAVALVLARVAEQAPELEDRIMLTCMELVDIDPSAAALVIITIKDKVPDIGERIERIAIAYGLEEQYLKAASPVRPS